MRLEQERSRMLQAISSESRLRDLLEELCVTCEALMAGVSCACIVMADEHLCIDPIVTGTTLEEDLDLPVYEARVEDGHGASDRLLPRQPKAQACAYRGRVGDLRGLRRAGDAGPSISDTCTRS